MRPRRGATVARLSDAIFTQSPSFPAHRSVSIPRSGSVARHESCRKRWCPCTCCPHITCRSPTLHAYRQSFKCKSS
ncbi:unnamed protein product [Spodoptera exigua]|nr:unnamed protein product [Spodoptera exigua]